MRGAFADEHFPERAREVAERIGPALALGVTGGGAPRHPLYLAADAPLVAWAHQTPKPPAEAGGS